MNTKTIEKRINRNLDRTKRDLAALKDDTVTGLSMKIGQLADGPIKSTTEAMKTLNKIHRARADASTTPAFRVPSARSPATSTRKLPAIPGWRSRWQ